MSAFSPVHRSVIKSTPRLSMTRTQVATIAKDKLIETAKDFMAMCTGYYSPLDMEKLADDFVFRGPVIGPLGKQDYAQVLDYFKVYNAFPDIEPNCFGFSVDPQDDRRVWFFLRSTGTYQKKLGGFLGDVASSVASPDSRPYRGSPEAWSLTFNDKKQVRYISAGYVVDLFDPQATTGGKGLTFGILATLGLSLPSGSGSPALQAIQKFTNAVDGIFPKAYSEPSKIPSWWKSDKFGADI